MLEFQEEIAVKQRSHNYGYEDSIKYVDAAISNVNKCSEELHSAVSMKNPSLISLAVTKFIKSCLALANASKNLGDMTGNCVDEVYSADVPLCGCRIVEEESSTRIIFDTLIPKKIKYKKNKNADLSNIYAAYLAEYYKVAHETEHRLYNEPVILVFLNHFCSKTDMIDPDNMDYHAFLDAISATFLVDDGPEWCAYFMDSVMDTRNFSEFIIFPKRLGLQNMIKHLQLPDL